MLTQTSLFDLYSIIATSRWCKIVALLVSMVSCLLLLMMCIQTYVFDY